MSIKAILTEQQKSYTKAEEDTLLDTKVPTSRTINNKALSSNITLDAADVNALASGGTAVGANNLRHTYTILGNSSRWYKFLEFPVEEGTSRKFVLFLTDGGYNYQGIINCLFNRSVGVPINGDVTWWARTAYEISDIRYDFDQENGKVIMYIYKRSSTNALVYTLLSSTRSEYYDLSSYFTTVQVSEPTTATSAGGVRTDTDVNGDQIDTTYLKSADAANTYLPATSSALHAKRLDGLHVLYGDAGWYKIMDFTIETSNNSSRNFVLVVMDTYQTFTGIAKINFRRTSATAIQCTPEWIAFNGHYLRAFAYTVNGSTGKCELFFRKATSTTYDTKFQCITSTTLNTWIEATAIPWYTDGAAAPISALPDNAVIANAGNMADRAYRMTPAKVFTGNEGWYKFFEVSLSSNNRYQFVFLITQGNATRQGLLQCSLTRSSSTAGSAWVSWLAVYGHMATEVKYNYTFTNGVATLSLYLSKTGGSTYGSSVTVLRSTQQNGNPISPYQYFIETPSIETVPSTAITAKAPSYSIRHNNVAVSAGTNQQIISISDGDLTDGYVLSKIEFANPEYITTGYTWTTTDGGFTLTGTCTAATTANIVLTLAYEHNA